MSDDPTLLDSCDALLLDLDGTLFRGHAPTAGAVQTLASFRARALFVTNNASRSADEVAAHLTELGFTATAGDVVTSAQSAARLLAERLPADSAVLVVGTDALSAEVALYSRRFPRAVSFPSSQPLAQPSPLRRE